MTPETNISLQNEVGVMTILEIPFSKDPRRVETKYIDLLCNVVGRFMHGPVFDAGGYFRTDRHALVCGSFSVFLSSLMLNLVWPCG